MNRRRSLKYAGVTTAVVGAALGVDYLLRPVSMSEALIVLVFNVIATVVALGAAIGSLLSVRTSQRTSEAQLYYDLLERYAQPEMGIALRTLVAWRGKYGPAFADEWDKRRRTGDTEAEEVDKARRHVSHFFQTAWALHKPGYVTNRFVEAICEHFTGIQTFLEIVEPLEAKLSPTYDRKAFDGFRGIWRKRPHRIFT